MSLDDMTEFLTGNSCLIVITKYNMISSHRSYCRISLTLTCQPQQPHICSKIITLMDRFQIQAQFNCFPYIFVLFHSRNNNASQSPRFQMFLFLFNYVLVYCQTRILQSRQLVFIVSDRDKLLELMPEKFSTGVIIKTHILLMKAEYIQCLSNTKVKYRNL